MSGLFDDGDDTNSRSRGDVAPVGTGRSRALLITAGIVVAAVLFTAAFSGFWTERLWFDATGYRSVWSKLVWTRIGLFLVFGLLMAVAVAGNMVAAYRLRPFFRPASSEQTSLDRYREAVTPIRLWILIGVAGLMGVFAGTSAAGEWRQYLLWRNGVPFGSKDPVFNRDIGFYVFDLPWLHFLVDFVMAVAVISLLVAAVTHYLYGGIRLQSPHDRLSGPAQAQLSILLGVFVLAKAADYYLDRYDLLTDSGRLIDGMTYTDDHAVLPAKNILMGIAVICALLFFLNVWRRTWLLPTVGLGLFVLSAILLGAIWPGIVQQFQVSPSEADKEAPYIKRNIDATRSAYDLESVEVAPYTGKTEIDKNQAAELNTKSESVPLVDPQLVRATFEQRQQVRGYYSVADVLDVDRYPVDGTERALVLGVRELDQSGINESNQNWSNLHTVYTHGYGVIAAYANQRSRTGATVSGDQEEDAQWAERNLPPEGALTGLAPDGYEGRVYFGEQSPTYSIVGKPEGEPSVELDLPSGESEESGEQTTTYDGDAGVPIGGPFNKFLYAVKFGEPNIVLSGRVNESSKILYNRNPRTMVEKIAPWLTVDRDPLPAVVDGRVVWILDGYTTTDRYPLSESESFEEMTDDALERDPEFRTLPTDEINYMRNAVKATVDAYDGTVTLYAWDDEDPMLKAWSAAFPGTIEPRSEISPELMQHLRYPEDLFKVQRYQFARYHVTDASDFYEGNDRWQVPEDPYKSARLQAPYRLFVPDSEDEGAGTFSLTSVYVPHNRDNLAAFVAVNSDATDEEGYGQIRVLRLPSQTQVFGPSQMANEFAGNDRVRDALRDYTTGESAPVFGNLLTLPVADGLMYVQPVYTQRVGGTASYPILRFVLVSFGDEVGIGSTLPGAIANVLGLADPPPTGEEPPDPGEQPDDSPGQTPLARAVELLRDAEEAYADADAALAEGDLAGYQEATERAERLTNQALALLEGSGTEEPTDDPVETPTTASPDT
jgi:uncharacterized membrane protein (UPF0182 family)